MVSGALLLLESVVSSDVVVEVNEWSPPEWVALVGCSVVTCGVRVVSVEVSEVRL